MGARKEDPKRWCRNCGTELVRKRFSTGRLEDRGRFVVRSYCDPGCQAAAIFNPDSTNRQTMYSRSRKHLKLACERCGERDRLHVHHRDEDITNNEPANLETLCVLCHNRHHFQGLSRTGPPDLEASATALSRRSLSGSDTGSSTTRAA